jgi:hypothetical protein
MEYASVAIRRDAFPQRQITHYFLVTPRPVGDDQSKPAGEERQVHRFVLSNAQIGQGCFARSRNFRQCRTRQAACSALTVYHHGHFQSSAINGGVRPDPSGTGGFDSTGGGEGRPTVFERVVSIIDLR